MFGVGDGGGGPKPENIELGMRMSNLENSPRVSFDTAKNFFYSEEYQAAHAILGDSVIRNHQIIEGA